MTAPDLGRCNRCGWPLKATIKEGCTEGNCEQRPLPPIREVKAPVDVVVEALARVAEQMIEDGQDERMVALAGGRFIVASIEPKEDEQAAGVCDVNAVRATIRRAAVVLIERFSDGRLLCVWNRRYNGWSLPGGKVEGSETPEAAAVRELFEETGLVTEERYCEPVFDGPHGIEVEASRGSRVHIFRVDSHWNHPPHEREPGCPVTWFTREEFLKASPFASLYERVFALVLPEAGAK